MGTKQTQRSNDDMKLTKNLDLTMLQSRTATALVCVIKNLMRISKTNTKHCKQTLGQAQKVVTMHEKAMRKIDPRSMPRLIKTELYKSVIR